MVLPNTVLLNRIPTPLMSALELAQLSSFYSAHFAPNLLQQQLTGISTYLPFDHPAAHPLLATRYQPVTGKRWAPFRPHVSQSNIIPALSLQTSQPQKIALQSATTLTRKSNKETTDQIIPSAWHLSVAQESDLSPVKQPIQERTKPALEKTTSPSTAKSRKTKTLVQTSTPEPVHQEPQTKKTSKEIHQTSVKTQKTTNPEVSFIPSVETKELSVLKPGSVSLEKIFSFTGDPIAVRLSSPMQAKISRINTTSKDQTSKPTLTEAFDTIVSFIQKAPKNISLKKLNEIQSELEQLKLDTFFKASLIGTSKLSRDELMSLFLAAIIHVDTTRQTQNLKETKLASFETLKETWDKSLIRGILMDSGKRLDENDSSSQFDSNKISGPDDGSQTNPDGGGNEQQGQYNRQ